MPKGFLVFLFFFLSLAAKCCINSLAEMLIHQTLLVRNACVLSNRDCFFFWEFRCLFCDKFQILWPQEIPHPYLVLDCHHRFRPIGYTFKTSHGWRGMIFLNYYYYFHIFIIELNSLLFFLQKILIWKLDHRCCYLSILEEIFVFKGPLLSRHMFFNWNWSDSQRYHLPWFSYFTDSTGFQQEVGS